jgi:hypothetical protein
LEKSRNKIWLHTQMKEKIISIDPEEAILQSYASLLMEASARYQRKTKPLDGASCAIRTQPETAGLVSGWGTDSRANGYLRHWWIDSRWWEIHITTSQVSTLGELHRKPGNRDCNPAEIIHQYYYIYCCGPLVLVTTSNSRRTPVAQSVSTA